MSLDYWENNRMNKDEIKKTEIRGVEIVAMILMVGTLIWLIFSR